MIRYLDPAEHQHFDLFLAERAREADRDAQAQAQLARDIDGELVELLDDELVACGDRPACRLYLDGIRQGAYRRMVRSTCIRDEWLHRAGVPR